MSPSAAAAKHILPKGLACASCKARKVKCDAVRPACSACRRSAKFRGEDPSTVTCVFFEGKRCSTGGAGHAKAKRVKSMKEAAKVEEEKDAPATSPAATLPLRQTPSAPASSPVASTSASTSRLPVPSVYPSTADLPAQLPLPAPIALYPATVPAFLAVESLPPVPLLPSDPPSQSEFDEFLKSLEMAPGPLQYTDKAASPFSPSSPSSASSLSSFISDNSDGSASSSLLDSPFSLSEDYDLAFPTSFSSPEQLVLPSPYPPSFPAISTISWAAVGADPHAFDSAFLPTAHDCDTTLSLSLFEHPFR
ncbi:hypothetical protein JCM11251_001679 [Rhodosporidiobolus azoricus]